MPELEKYDALEKEARAWALVTKRDMLTLLASFGLDEKNQGFKNIIQSPDSKVSLYGKSLHH
jgi:hypothetical protein